MSRALTKSVERASKTLVACRYSTSSLPVVHKLSAAAATATRPQLTPIVHNGTQHQQLRHSSHSPMGAPPANPRKKVTLQTIQNMYKKSEPITMLTAYDFPSAHVADHAGIDLILVGDSLAMVSMGLEDTSEVTMEEMIFASRAVARATKTAFIIGDLPMGSYEVNPEQAVRSSIEMIKKGRSHSVKLEGGKEMAPTIKAITDAGIPVLAHVGLTPQRQNALGGFRVQGKTAASAIALLTDALAVQEAGAWGVVLEAIPPEIASIITAQLRIPTIGIGAGAGCSGQVLVQVDMLGNFPPGRYMPKFAKKYGNVWGEAHRAIEQYKNEVKARTYPSKEYTYEVKPDEVRKFEQLVAERYGSRTRGQEQGLEGLGGTAVPESTPAAAAAAAAV
ncbi:3-methyl-2-oxobutanoate hydroxymethyltransferase [Verruconis gallopava]|uniref:3-methyl-2-oxobutanoate hydroxymethyltransferase n=1 Tax=Verruconis gallopava TaxID=253628 RepID=A0A0D2AYG2_9PEZI|nr:3-methyl-2-oxobutanoate hydroxymethyltransferase [Verruconis gallopava]KIW04209.1 3-methyl-2-oxobutanoate hydroxymethyltransferase [Verruconis gallopava]